jgi:hypothetical protein
MSLILNYTIFSCNLNHGCASFHEPTVNNVLTLLSRTGVFYVAHLFNTYCTCTRIFNNKISVMFSFIFSFYLAIVILANLIKIVLFEVFVFSLTVGTYVRTNLRLRLVFPLPSASPDRIV